MAVLEDGTLIATGNVVNIAGNVHTLSLTTSVSTLTGAPTLQVGLVERVRAIPKPYLKGPVTSFLIPLDKKDGVFDIQWFDAAVSFFRSAIPNGKATPAAPENNSKAKMPAPTKSVETAAPLSSAGDEREALLKGWIPPVLNGLLADHVRADQWELMVAYALRALGCQVTYMGNSAAGQAVPDCIARYTSPAGQVIELIVDAKAGQWNGAVDDIRAMRDYVALATPYSFPLFVANSLTKDVTEKLRQHVMHGKVARAICGRDIALLIAQRLTDPNFNVEFELRRFFL
ncbi:MAG: hypothetical protein HZB26_06630 [Candidatus Hydrogenedentes bacterium]|nr:hypothetical protein [Candidatus Hydrogenedentota bacterium]